MYNHAKFQTMLMYREMKSVDFCKMTGISSGNLSDWKNGKAKPSIESIEKMATVLNCSVDYLLDRTDEPRISEINLTESENNFLNIFRSLDDKGKILVEAEIYKQQERME